MVPPIEPPQPRQPRQPAFHGRRRRQHVAVASTTTIDQLMTVEEKAQVMASKTCPICQEQIAIPVSMPECKECNSHIRTMGCLLCVRKYLGLNKPKDERYEVKHLHCPAQYESWNLNAKKAYTVEMGAMRLLVTAGIRPPPCSECDESFDSHLKPYAHVSPGSQHFTREEKRLTAGVVPCRSSVMDRKCLYPGCGFKCRGTWEAMNCHYTQAHAAE